MSQLSLHWSAPDRDRMVFEAILEIIGEVVARASLKEVAFRLGVAPPSLANAIKERDRHYVRLDWLPALMELAAEHDLAERLGGALVAPARLVVTAAEPMTPEQEVRALRDALADFGASGVAAMRKRGVR